MIVKIEMFQPAASLFNATECPSARFIRIMGEITARDGGDAAREALPKTRKSWIIRRTECQLCTTQITPPL
jgi:hypothetical protein